MIAAGMVPYTDFFWSQLTLMPQLFSHLSDLGWTSFYILRGFAVLAGILSAILLVLIVYRITNDIKVSVIILAMYAFSGMSLAWHTTFKTLAFCHFLSIATFFFWYLFSRKKSLIYLILTGMFLSALINMRSIFIVLLPIYFISIYYLSDKTKFRNLLLLAVSLIPFAIPTFIYLINSPDHFFYGNFFFQLTRDVNRTLGDVLYNRIGMFFRAIIDPHLLIIFLLTIWSTVQIFKAKKLLSFKSFFVKPEGITLLNLTLIAFIYLLPHPAARQYIDNYMVFGLIIIGSQMNQLWSLLKDKFAPNWRKLLIGGMASLYILSMIPYFVIFIAGVRDRDKMYRLSEAKAVTDHMMSIAAKSDTVLTEWPGHSYLTGQTPLKNTEIIAYDFTLPITREEYKKYNLCDSTYLREEIEKKSPKLVVFPNRVQVYYAAALEENYNKTFQTEKVSVYKRK
jgi:hypothetical protein